MNAQQYQFHSKIQPIKEANPPPISYYLIPSSNCFPNLPAILQSTEHSTQQNSIYNNTSQRIFWFFYYPTAHKSYTQQNNIYRLQKYSPLVTSLCHPIFLLIFLSSSLINLPHSPQGHNTTYKYINLVSLYIGVHKVLHCITWTNRGYRE